RAASPSRSRASAIVSPSPGWPKEVAPVSLRRARRFQRPLSCSVTRAPRLPGPRGRDTPGTGAPPARPCRRALRSTPIFRIRSSPVSPVAFLGLGGNRAEESLLLGRQRVPAHFLVVEDLARFGRRGRVLALAGFFRHAVRGSIARVVKVWSVSAHRAAA